MIISPATLKSLSPSKIESSEKIQLWLSQFSKNEIPVAKVLLSHLKFVSRDTFSQWLEQTIQTTISNSSDMFALYSVRKLNTNNENYNDICYWDKEGRPDKRPGSSLGSEDLVYSLISNLARSNKEKILEHPPLSDLKKQHIRNYILVDDSIGSGDRVFSFINAMLKHPTFLSWWNFGWVKIHIISFSRPRESEKNILQNIIGSDHNKSKIKKSSKITFTSAIVYQQAWYKERWGKNYSQLIKLCEGQSKIKNFARLGYGNVFSNIIFYHSVPNNTPGIIWFGNQKWKALMPNRVLPSWLKELLETPDSKISNPSLISEELLYLLKLIKRGVRNVSSLAQRLEVDYKYAKNLCQYANSMALITANKLRLTPRGQEIIRKANKKQDLQSWDYNMYIPKSWCTDRFTTQPSMKKDYCNPFSLTESTIMDGDIGQISLDKSDVKAVALPFNIESYHYPAETWDGLDTDGPLWGPQKEK